MKVFLVLLCLVIGSYAHADRIKLLANDHDALQARVDIVQQAQSEILAEYYSVWNDDQSVGGFALLLEAAKRGIKVKIIMDAISNTVPKSFFTTMMENGKDALGNVNVEIKLYNPPNLNLFKLPHRDHSKMLIVDGKVMITGGRNIGDKYFGLNKKRNFSDLDVILDGKAVTQARENFLETFNGKLVKDASRTRDLPSKVAVRICRPSSTTDNVENCERRKKMLLKRYHESFNRIESNYNDIMEDTPDSVVKPNTGTDWLADVDDGAEIKFLSQDPHKLVSKKTANLTYALYDLLGSAKRDINILSPYLIPTKEMSELFQELIDRGVRIRVVTNSLLSTDNLFAQAGYLNSKKKMIDMGIELYECNGPNTCHGKAMVVDDSITFVGTYNLDPRSAYVNREIGIVILSSPNNEVAKELDSVIEKFRQNSLLVGKDGKTQNEKEQKNRYKSIGKGKRSMLRTLRIIAPLIKHQI